MKEEGVSKMLTESKSRRNEESFMLYALIAKASHSNALLQFFYQPKSSHEKLFTYTFMC